MDSKRPITYKELKYKYILGNPIRIPYGNGEKYIELGGGALTLIGLCIWVVLFPITIMLLEYKTISRVLIFIFVSIVLFVVMKPAVYWVYRLKLYIMNKRGELL